MTGPIVIEDYNPLWPQQFEKIRARIAPSLGELAAAIEHIGSTAVPGLAAKPIIDVDILLKNSTDMSLAISKLAALGYQHQGNLGVPERDAFKAPYHDVPQHVYVCSPGSHEFSRHIAFRDHLRANHEDAAAYAALKRKLVREFHLDRDAYTKAKSDFIDAILRREG
jgi:GrpB-like predicted nucleotidyltransferase (UPF0157 family)